MIPNNVMLQQFSISIKTILNELNINHEINFNNPVSADEFEMIEHKLMEYMYKSEAHIHLSHDSNADDLECSSHKLHYKGRDYERNFITFNAKERKPVDGKVIIPLYKCNKCNHWHALLPAPLIVPYSPYSLFFILSVLYDKECGDYTVEEIINTYGISVSTLYRWIASFSAYKRCYIKIRNELHMSLFVLLLTDHETVINEIFSRYKRTLFQADLKFSE